MSKNCVFTANTPKQKISLFKIKEIKNPQDNSFFDLLITFPGSNKYLFDTDLKKLISTNSEFSYKKAANPHTTVHYNPINENIVIKKTYKDKSQQEEDIFQLHINPGMKRDELFVPVVFRSYGNTHADKFKYTEKKNCNEIPLDFSYDPNQDTLQVALIVSLIKKEYFSDIEFPANTISHDFNNFKVTLIYKIFNRPSLPQSININHSLGRGLDWWEINNLITHTTILYSTDYFKNYK